MMRWLCIPIWLSLAIVPSQAQNSVDEGKTNAETLTDSARLMNAVAKGYRNLKTNLDTSYHYALETFSLSSTADPAVKVYALNLQGDVMLRLGNSEKALELFKEGLSIRLAEDVPDSGSLSYLYNQIGDAYWQLKDTSNAVAYYRQSMRWTARSIYNHPLHEGICSRLCHIGWFYLAHNQLDSATWYAQEAMQVGDKLSAITNLLLGDIELKKQNPADALDYFRSSIDLGFHHDKNLEIVLLAYQRMIAIFESVHQGDSALVYARNAFMTANNLRDAGAIGSSAIALANIFAGRHQLDSAVFYQQKALESTRTQLDQERERQALNVYFNEKIKEQIVASERKQHTARLWLFVLLGGLVVLVLLGLLYRMRLKSNFEKKMRSIEMRALRAQMNPHFIFNCLGSINRYIVKSDTRTASNYLTKFAKLIRLILDNSASDHISLDAELQTLQLYLDMETLRFEGGFDYEIEKDGIGDGDDILLPSMLIQPYVENAIWHGLLQKEEKGKLWIRFRRINGHMLQAEIEDNGIGRKNASALKSKDSLKHKSYGMQISRDRIELINNLYKMTNSVTIRDLTDDSGNALGTIVILNIPVT